MDNPKRRRLAELCSTKNVSDSALEALLRNLKASDLEAGAPKSRRSIARALEADATTQTENAINRLKRPKTSKYVFRILPIFPTNRGATRLLSLALSIANSQSKYSKKAISCLACKVGQHHTLRALG